ncbi:hypothetical protein [Flavobacterium supellecticarium]|uniref:hypothetical protein n=1 Tax=Flavobacterium supellecticarium TaxID=2565924 RepID=UPI001B3B2959|nr:hypothetical protein [Flavobacterium supellecticarium]
MDFYTQALKFGKDLTQYANQKNIDVSKLAISIGCSKSTLLRLMNSDTLPTLEMIQQVDILKLVGFEAYKKMPKSKRYIDGIKFGGAAAGVFGATSVISGLGTTAGLSAAGISSGLAALGGVIGGGMAFGIAVTAAIPVAAAATSVGIYKGVKKGVSVYNDYQGKLDDKWEWKK